MTPKRFRNPPKIPATKPQPPRRMTGSEPGRLNGKDIAVSAGESAGWSGAIGTAVGGAITGLSTFGYELRDSLPWVALSFPIEIVAATALVAFALIFITKLYRRKQADNRPGGIE